MISRPYTISELYICMYIHVDIKLFACTNTHVKLSIIISFSSLQLYIHVLGAGGRVVVLIYYMIYKHTCR